MCIIKTGGQIVYLKEGEELHKSIIDSLIEINKFFEKRTGDVIDIDQPIVGQTNNRSLIGNSFFNYSFHTSRYKGVALDTGFVDLFLKLAVLPTQVETAHFNYLSRLLDYSKCGYRPAPSASMLVKVLPLTKLF